MSKMAKMVVGLPIATLSAFFVALALSREVFYRWPLEFSILAGAITATLGIGFFFWSNTDHETKLLSDGAVIALCAFGFIRLMSSPAEIWESLVPVWGSAMLFMSMVLVLISAFLDGRALLEKMPDYDLERLVFAIGTEAAVIYIWAFSIFRFIDR